MVGGIEYFTEDLRHRLAAVFGSRPWVVASEVVQGATFMAAGLKAAGASDVVAVGAVMGVGPVPEGIPTMTIGMDGIESMLDSIRTADVLFHDPPGNVLAFIEEWDASGDARTIVDFTMSGGTVCGRASFGGRGDDWVALEDKLVAREIWRSAGLRTADDEVVDLSDLAGCLAAHRRLRTDLGTVWAGDNREGWHGGADGTYWVPDAEVAHEVVETMRDSHDVARIMPFVEGIPCSVLGMVTADRTIAFRPMELFIYRDFAAHRIVYGKASSHWDPPVADRVEMRTAAVAVGEEMRRRADYRGIFTLDGIMSAEGFVPTEVNPRFGGALPGLLDTPGGLINLMFVNLCVVEGELDDIDSAELERWVLGDLDGRRRGIGMLETSNAPSDDQQMFVALDAQGRLCEVDEAGDAICNVMWGAKAPHGLIRMIALDGIEHGSSKAGLFLDIAKFADANWNIGIPNLIPATDVRL